MAIHQLEYEPKGSSHIVLAGSAVEVSIPSGSYFAEIDAEIGVVWFTVNGDATIDSPGHVIPGESRTVHLANVTKLSIYGERGSEANILFYGSISIPP